MAFILLVAVVVVLVYVTSKATYESYNNELKSAEKMLDDLKSFEYVFDSVVEVCKKVHLIHPRAVAIGAVPAKKFRWAADYRNSGVWSNSRRCVSIA